MSAAKAACDHMKSWVQVIFSSFSLSYFLIDIVAFPHCRCCLSSLSLSLVLIVMFKGHPCWRLGFNGSIFRRVLLHTKGKNSTPLILKALDCQMILWNAGGDVQLPSHLLWWQVEDCPGAVHIINLTNSLCHRLSIRHAMTCYVLSLWLAFVCRACPCPSSQWASLLRPAKSSARRERRPLPSAMPNSNKQTLLPQKKATVAILWRSQESIIPLMQHTKPFNRLWKASWKYAKKSWGWRVFCPL